MVVHREIRGSGCTVRVPAHWLVRLNGGFQCGEDGGDCTGEERGELDSSEEPGWCEGREEGGGEVGLWESGKLDATGRRLFVSRGREEEVEERGN